MDIQQSLLDQYKSSTFNICEHRASPLMKGPPMQLTVDTQAKPGVHHTPVPIPHRWQNEVKSGFDQVVKLGIMEPVLIGEPVTWCHCMVVCAKKIGSPQRTVDFQALNAHTIQRNPSHTVPISSSPICST